jgi:hypothetical protein
MCRNEHALGSASDRPSAAERFAQKREGTMMIATRTLRPSVQRFVVKNGARSMTILSKESGEEYQKKVISVRRSIARHRILFSLC